MLSSLSLMLAAGLAVAGCAKGASPLTGAGDDDGLGGTGVTDAGSSLPPDAAAGGGAADAAAPLPPDAAPLPPDAAPLPPDAAPLPPDAAPLPPPDAAPLPPDAAPLPPDAAPPCTVQTINLLTNANFDTGPGGGWSESSSRGFHVIVNQADAPEDAFSSPDLAYLAGANDVDDVLWQDVAVPADATGVHLTGHRWFETNDDPGDAYDTTIVEITDTSNAQLEGLADWSNQDDTSDWTAFNLPVTGNYQGQTIRLRIRSSADGSYVTTFLYDSLSLDVTTCR